VWNGTAKTHEKQARKPQEKMILRKMEKITLIR
jgi:hypothetical protein